MDLSFTRQLQSFVNPVFSAKGRYVTEGWKNCEGKLDDEHELQERDFAPEMNGLDTFKIEQKDSVEEKFFKMLEDDYQELKKEQAALSKEYEEAKKIKLYSKFQKLR